MIQLLQKSETYSKTEIDAMFDNLLGVTHGWKIFEVDDILPATCS